MQSQKVRAKLRGFLEWLEEYFDPALELIAFWDKKLLEAIQGSRYLRKFYWVFRVATRVGDGYLWGLVGLFVLLFGGNIDRYYVFIALAITGVNMAIYMSLKRTFRRGRPSYELVRKRSRRFIGRYSFPSGHTASSFSIAFLIAHFYPILAFQVLAYTAASLIGFSRIYLGEHYPSDVLFGAALGTGITVILLPFLKILFGV